MLGPQIKRMRQRQEMTQQHLAEQVGVSWHTVRQWEGGRREPSLEFISHIASVLGTSSEQLLRPLADAPLRRLASVTAELEALRADVEHLRLELSDVRALHASRPPAN